MAKTVPFSGADVSCFHVAAAWYGDMTQWWRVMQASGLSDPALTGIGTLTIPPSNPGLSGGLPKQ